MSHSVAEASLTLISVAADTSRLVLAPARSALSTWLLFVSIVVPSPSTFCTILRSHSPACNPYLAYTCANALYSALMTKRREPLLEVAYGLLAETGLTSMEIAERGNLSRSWVEKFRLRVYRDPGVEKVERLISVLEEEEARQRRKDKKKEAAA